MTVFATRPRPFPGILVTLNCLSDPISEVTMAEWCACFGCSPLQQSSDYLKTAVLDFIVKLHVNIYAPPQLFSEINGIQILDYTALNLCHCQPCKQEGAFPERELTWTVVSIPRSNAKATRPTFSQDSSTSSQDPTRYTFCVSSRWVHETHTIYFETTKSSDHCPAFISPCRQYVECLRGQLVSSSRLLTCSALTEIGSATEK
jgi:hypothetical protein